MLAVTPNQAPVVNAGPDQSLTALATSTTLVGSATDDGLPAQSKLSYVWSVLSAPAGVSFTTPTAASTGVSLTFPGTYTFQLAVSDGEKTGKDTVSVSVAVPASTTGQPPTVAINSPADDSLITKPTDVLGTVSDGAWVLDYRLGGRDDVNTPWTVMASGVGARSNADLAKFDPTMLVNGIYTVRLSATSTAGSASTSISLSVDGRMKIGNFTLAWVDLESPVANLPFTITRTYDSRVKTVGDFGVGWNLGIRDVRVEKSGKIGAYWEQQTIDLDFFGFEYCLKPLQAATVTITFPSGRQYRFHPKASVAAESGSRLPGTPDNCQVGEPLSDADIVWVSDTDPDNPTVKLDARGGTSVFTNGAVGALVQLVNFSDFEIWDPRQFRLTVEDGSVYDIDQDVGVTRITDRNNNTVTIGPDGIVHSSGKKIAFARDNLGRITSITDPMGKANLYAYDAKGDLATFTDRAGNATTFDYAGNHYLQEIHDPLGRRPIRNEYDENNRLIRTIDAAGNATNYTHELDQNEEQVIDRLGHVSFYKYNTQGDIVEKTDAAGAVWKYSYDFLGNQLSATDPLGHTKSAVFNGQNVPTSKTDELGNVTRCAYNAFRELLTATDPLGHVSSSKYDESGNETSTTDALGNTTRYTYDSKGNQLTSTDPLGNVTQHSYDSNGHLTQTTDALAHLTSYAFDAGGRMTRETTARVTANGLVETLVKTLTLDSLGRVTLMTYPDGTNSSSTYTSSGKLVTTTDELGRETRYTYDQRDEVVAISYPDGTVETHSYDAENRESETTDPAGHTTRFTRDVLGRLTDTTFADGTSTSTTYDSVGREISTSDELGRVSQRVFDAAGRQTSATNPLGAITLYGHDAKGNQTTTTDALGRTTSVTYDALDRAVAMRYADGSGESSLFDAAGRQVGKTNELGQVTTFGYDAMGRLTSVTDALGHSMQHTYDELGHRVSQTDANGQVTRFVFDQRGRELSRTLPDGATETRVYDAAGQVQARVDFSGRATTYSYDAMGRERSRTYPDGSMVSFEYTPGGLVASEVDARGTTTRAYDARNQITRLTYPDGRALSMGYDAAGERTALTVGIGSQTWTTTTAYDGAGQPAEVIDPLGRVYSVAYDSNGNRTRLDKADATSTTYTYDARNRLISLDTERKVGSASTTIQAYAYSIDAAGNRTSCAESDGTVRAFAYDGAHRLTAETVSAGSGGEPSYAKTFVYDPVGNRLTQATTGAGAGLVVYTYDGRDRLMSENATSYSYDVNGNLTSKSGEATYSWDFENRLTSVSVGDGPVVENAYDATGRLLTTTLRTTLGGSLTVTKFLVDTASDLSQVVAESDDSNALAALYVRVGDELLAVMRPSSNGGYTTQYVHHDGLLSVRALTDETGARTDKRAYEAFGTRYLSTGTAALAYGFAGEPFQRESGIAYHRARWMDARVGRFLAMDPSDPGVSMQSPLDGHPFLYANDNPVNETDPFGLFSTNEGAGVVTGTQILSLTAVASAVGKTAAIACALETAVSTVSTDPSRSPCQAFSVRLQAQGPKTIKSANTDVIEESVAMGPREAIPFSVAEGLAGLEVLKGKLGKRELKDRKDQFVRAARYIERGPPTGWAPPGDHFGHRERDSVRVDVEIKMGINFIR